MPLLPGDEVRQQVQGRLGIRDEVVVHEVDGLGAALAQAIQLGHHLLRAT